jgi:hypothetical protein
MGVSYDFVCPPKRQHLNPWSKYSTLMETPYALGLGLLLCDERRLHDGPLAIAGTWAGSEIFICGDSSADPTLAEAGLEELFAERQRAHPDTVLIDSIWHVSQGEFDDVELATFQALHALLPGVDLSGLAERVPAAVAEVMGPYGDGEQFYVVCPEKQQYVDPRQLGERATIERALLGWPGRIVGDLLLHREWRGPVYVAGEFSKPCPPAIETPMLPHEKNLFYVAQSEFAEVSLTSLLKRAWLHFDDLLADAQVNDRLFVALGKAANGADGQPWQAALARTFGNDWRKHWSLAAKHHSS